MYQQIKDFALNAAEDIDIVSFKGSEKWYKGLLKWCNLSERQPTHKIEKTLESIGFDIIRHIVNVRHLINKHKIPMKSVYLMDETGVHTDMDGGPTVTHIGAKVVSSFDLANTKENITVMWCVRGEGVKIKPLIVYKTKSASKIDPEDLGRVNCIVAYASSGWVNQTILSKYIDYLFPFDNKGLIVWDCATQHSSPDITKHIANKQIHVEFVPPGCTGFIQVADVGLIKPMKDYIRGKFANHYKQQTLILRFQQIYQKPKQQEAEKAQNWKLDIQNHPLLFLECGL